jgi:hypothetical protein
MEISKTETLIRVRLMHQSLLPSPAIDRCQNGFFFVKSELPVTGKRGGGGGEREVVVELG